MFCTMQRKAEMHLGDVNSSVRVLGSHCQRISGMTIRKDTCPIDTNKWFRFCMCCGNKAFTVRAMAAECVMRQKGFLYMLR